MKAHRFNYPQDLGPCQFCKPDKDADTVPRLTSAIIRMPDGNLSTAFSLKCPNCEYETKSYEYPDVVCHAWNMARKLEVAGIVDEITAAKKDSE